MDLPTLKKTTFDSSASDLVVMSSPHIVLTKFEILSYPKIVGYTAGVMENVRCALVFNGFCYIDDHLAGVVRDCLKVLKDKPCDTGEDLAYTYFKGLLCN